LPKPFGFEEILTKELLQWRTRRAGVRMVSFKGIKFMYKANLSLRTALKILKPIYFFKANNELYIKGCRVNWSNTSMLTKRL
jgi:putative N6-adenine-specific DNA methylase